MTTLSAEQLAEVQTLIDAAVAQSNADTDAFFLIFSAALVFMMQAGFAMLCAGTVRMKNAKNIMLKNVLDACVGALGFWAVGYGVAYGSNPGNWFCGNAFFFLQSHDTRDSCACDPLWRARARQRAHARV